MVAALDGSFPSIFDVRILENLADRDYFLDVVDSFYKEVAHDWGCRVLMSERRLSDAFDNWKDDRERTRFFGFAQKDDTGTYRAFNPDSIQLDHFKVGAIVAFWLRRLCPINETYRLDRLLSDEALRDLRVDTDPYLILGTHPPEHFLDFGNELVSLLVGFYIILNVEMQDFEHRLQAAGKNLKPGIRERVLQKTTLSTLIIVEYPKLMKTKNISWHGLFMTYHALFEKVIEAW